MTKVATARAALRAAIDRACIARGEMQWTNGYRAARYAGEAEHERLYRKELEQLRLSARAELNADRAIAAYARAIRAVAKDGAARRAVSARGTTRGKQK